MRSFIKKNRDRRFFRWLLSFQFIENIYKEIFYNHKQKNFYIPDKIKPVNFFLKINKENINYVILSPLKELPIKSKKNINILVNSTDLNKFKKFCKKDYNGKYRLDLFSEISDNEFSNYIKGVPLYPKKIAIKSLKNFVSHNNIYYPDTKFADILYLTHILCHKGYKSGFLANSYSKKTKYVKNVSNIFLKSNSHHELSLDGIWNFLDNHNSLPPIDFLQKYSRINSYLEARLLRNRGIVPIKFKRLGCFILRDVDLKNIRKFISQMISDSEINVSIILSKILNKKERFNFINNTRGGNWPERDGGKPTSIIFMTCDRKVPETIFNKKLKDFKFEIRKNFCNRGRSKSKSTVLHSADDTLIANYYYSFLNSSK